MSAGASAVDLSSLASRLHGELHRDHMMRALYATDASEYQEMPLAVAFPRDEHDVGELVRFAHEHGVALVPRAAGTSLAGQVVSHGIIVDAGRYMNAILATDANARRVRVQPGIVRNNLNVALAPLKLFFPPETATANRAMIGGMVGNNSCGANSIVYGTTREHLVSARGFLTDGSLVTFGPLTRAEFDAKCAGPATSLEAKIYRTVRDLLADAKNRQLIRDNYPKPTVTRRNTGYALDRLMECDVFDASSAKPFNLCQLLAGSEGTLFFGTEFELNLEPIPPAGGLLCAHFKTIDESLRATLIAMRHKPFGCELIDRHILECTKANLEQAKNRFFVQGDPGAVLVIEIRNTDRAVIEREFAAIEAECRAAGFGYAFPTVWGADVNRVWDLRRAGQGLMNNVEGDAKPREVVEDTAVAVEDLPAYIADFDAMLKSKYGVSTVYYAHAGAGELHTRPLFNLKTAEGLRLFRGIATDVAILVKKYRGSLSGEHGDGRLRGEFIKFMVGDECYAMMRRIKETFDPQGIFNPGKIIDTPPMDSSLRHSPDHAEPKYDTFFDFASSQGVLGAAEKCTGVGECRKSHFAGGTMCPSYMATRDEKASTRGRANILRHALSHPEDLTDPWDSPEIADVMDLCLSCKGCKAECPSNVDMARLKAEWAQHYQDAHGVKLRSRLVANFSKSMRMASLWPAAYNWVISQPDLSLWIKKFARFHPKRSMPELSLVTLAKWHKKNANRLQPVGSALARADSPATPEARASALTHQPAYPNGRVYLFCDEFTNYNDADVGAAATELLNRLGYEVVIPEHVDSGRAHFSKGLVREAREFAIRNVELLKDVVTAQTPLIGIEPSAILGFRDEYPDLVPAELKSAAKALAKNALLIDEFIAREADADRIKKSAFTTRAQTIKLHGHCHQKALSSLVPSVKMLELPANYKVQLIPSGCCGMAGSFGYEEEHYEVSQQIGELVLFPTVRKTPEDVLIAAPGTSCRHQIKDGTGRQAQHPIVILRDALA
ncbi:MAG: FAD-binding protein [Opitutae bacterium]|nr:FAD-binding protein [Opitutae bacterium]